MGTVTLPKGLPQARITGHAQHQVHPLWDLGKRAAMKKESGENIVGEAPPPASSHLASFLHSPGEGSLGSSPRSAAHAGPLTCQPHRRSAPEAGQVSGTEQTWAAASAEAPTPGPWVQTGTSVSGAGVRGYQQASLGGEKHTGTCWAGHVAPPVGHADRHRGV